ncbi:bifunctional diaminohydroxyphosphoribosylaminopyrimidine deaminase/5-amino-6-(5-phosphoribosylamino)uracil reductase RibD [Nitratidesulfovibrio vulgaris]|uniref:bifunctional diaminohydroxyphosphoribosylaminopyrimidine deaminase/5-amino-6-(5-phosphoribosylamino)uracil reductase RibD n=1 Tax=Nitratidesulfovibrio vulgaris TaxID=881 RepID=UPI0013DEABF4|nr:bifunctional diaminohydroxyphosphoribosylaminopyrimidine deaminase/5-amino-6-(5-phosphoribosylamino)uracil reductase RibD [Nitratidesulfovibrio vulgaris]
MGPDFTPFMREAIALAERGRWYAAPNPTVGAVLVRDGEVAARGWHTGYGKPHAEVECLRDAASKGVDPAHCTLVVTLEPCNHHGKTPPCSHAIVEAGITRVVVGLADPNPVASGGAEYLRAHGVTVDMGVCEQECHDLVADFLTWKLTDLPYVILKLASTLDGRIATRSGHSQWISGAEARAAVHELRARIGEAGGAVLVGGTTLYTDDPQLTARVAPLPRRQPMAVVATRHVPHHDALPRIFRERPGQCVVWTDSTGAGTEAADALRTSGVCIMALPLTPSGRLDLRAGLTRLRADHGVEHVLCEGGGKLALSLLEAGLVGEFHLHMAPKIIGDAEAAPLFDGRAPLHMDEALRLRMTGIERRGDDCIMILRPGKG